MKLILDSNKKNYELMQLMFFILLRCDEKYFIESNENDKESMSFSWIHSIQSSLEKFGLDPSSYPQGSISANRNYYEALRNYCGGEFPDTTEFNYLRSSLKNFLYLRRDDSYHNGSLLFGSYFSVDRESGTRDPQVHRRVKYNLRHTGTALWLLIQETENKLTKNLEDSVISFFDSLEKYLQYQDEWHKDNLKSLTLSSAINVCKSLLKISMNAEVKERTIQIFNRCKEAVFHPDCLEESITGELNWKFPSFKSNPLGKYEYYLTGFSLAQLPEMVIDERIQRIVKGMINNKVDSPSGVGIPIHRLTYFLPKENILPDFGASSVVLYVLLYSLENELGGNLWLDYCKKNINWLLNFCLNTYDKTEYHHLEILENSSKILLLPNNSPDIVFDPEITSFITQLKDAIYTEMTEPTYNFHKVLAKIKSPAGLEHIKAFILKWEISRHYKNQNRWSFFGNANWSKIGEFCGGALKSVLS